MRLSHIRNLFVATVAVATLLGTAACGQATAQIKAKPSETRTMADSHVEIFVPTDGITLNQNNPTNKWGSFASAISEQLQKKGYSGSSITIKASGNLADQAKELTNHVTETDKSKKANKHDIVILAPALAFDAASRQFGDLLGDGTEALNENSSNLGALNSEDGSEESEKQQASITSISKSVASMRKKGTKVVLTARRLPGVSADAFIQTTDAYDIGALQAKQLALKLELKQATTSNPKRVEVVIPEESNTSISAEFFAGVWSVLGPFYRAKTAISPSGKLTSSSTKDDWYQVLVASDNADEVQKGFDSLLTSATTGKNRTKPVRLDGVIASNDFMATQVAEVLTQRGYTGSAADINPEITISGIVGNIAGNTDITKSKVPTPSKSADEGSKHSPGKPTTDSDEDEASQWPIVTGYGAYVSNIQSVVSGKQWLTGLEDRTGLAKDAAALCASFAATNSAGTVTKTVTLNGKKVPLVSRGLVSVVSRNVKAELIDTGYISAADAGI